jgi:hypothetical protein
MAFTGNYACNSFKTGMMDGVFNLTSGQIRIALYNNTATLNASTASYLDNVGSNKGEIVGTPGYTAGGQTLTIAQVPTTGGSGTTAYVSFENVSWTGAFTVRGALIYQNSVGKPAICVLDFGSDKSSSTTFTVQFPTPTNTSAIIRIS